MSSSAEKHEIIRKKFESVIKVQPRDIDINGHVHHSIYLDYLLAARYDQMERCYKMSMEDFLDLGLTWFARRYTIEFRSGIELNDSAVVRTWIEKIGKVTVDVAFEVESEETKKMAAQGTACFVLIDIAGGKPTRIPEEVRRKYSV